MLEDICLFLLFEVFGVLLLFCVVVSVEVFLFVLICEIEFLEFVIGIEVGVVSIGY